MYILLCEVLFLLWKKIEIALTCKQKFDVEVYSMTYGKKYIAHHNENVTWRFSSFLLFMMNGTGRAFVISKAACKLKIAAQFADNF